MPNAVLVEKRNELAARQKALHDIFETAGPDFDFSKVEALKACADSKARVEEIQRLNLELDALVDEVKALAEMEGLAAGVSHLGGMLKAGTGGMVHAEPQQSEGGVLVATKSMGELFTESKAFTAYEQGMGVGPIATTKIDLQRYWETKTLFETGAGILPESLRTGKIVMSAQAPIRVVQIIPKTTTTMAAVVFMKETTFVGGAAETSEGSTYGEAQFVLTPDSETVYKFGVWIPVTDEQLADVSYARDYLNNRLSLGLDLRLDSQLLTGNGAAPNIRGVLNFTSIQTYAKNADAADEPIPDAIYRAMVKVRVTGRANPTAAIFHPNNWRDIRLSRTGDGVYIWGQPQEAGPMRIWGLPVVETTGMTENTAVVGDFAVHSELAMRSGIDFQVTNSHASYFTDGKLAIRADFRLAFISYRDTAFCTVTNLNG